MRRLEELYKVALSGANYRIVQIVHPHLRVYAQNLDGRAALLVAGKLPEGRVIKDAKGFTVKSDRESSKPSVTITSDKLGASPLFLAFVDFILGHAESATDSDAALEALAKAVQEFHNFTARRSGRLSLDEIRGLIAELCFLRGLFKAGIPQSIAVSSWRGPYATKGIGTLDFVFADGVCVEVKSARQPAISIHVSSPEQLIPRDTPVFLAVLPIEEVPSSSPHGFTLPELISDLESVIASEDEAYVDLFRRGTTVLGLDITDEYYEQWMFQPGEFQAYEVGDNFPGIRADAIDPGVVKVSYSLMLSSLTSFETSFDSIIVRVADGSV